MSAGIGSRAGAGRGAAGVDFFVSHAGPDRAWAEWAAWHLREAGYAVELDAWDWAAGENFITRMHAAVDAAGRVIALLSAAYFADGRYTADEWSSALVKDEDGGPLLVPVQIERCPLPRLLRPLLRVELFDVDEREAVRRLLAAARGPRRPDGAPMFPGRGTAGVLTGRGEQGPRLPGVLPAVWNIGPRNPGFVGRDAALAAVHEGLRSAVAAVAVQALHGMGGVGKTQLAVEYAYRHADGYDLAWWVNAEEAGLIGEQFAALAGELGLAGPHADTASAAGAVRGYLRGHGRWLVVLDNAGSPRDIRQWLPAGPGHVLITSRNPGWRELAAPVEVDVLSRGESVRLLRTCRPGISEAEADLLAGALGDLPLALAQAGGFLAETGMPAGQYLDLLATHAAELLDQSPPDAHPHSLAAAIRLSTDRLAGVDPAALALVRIGAFLAPEPIAAELLAGQIPLPGGGPPDLQALAAAAASPIAARRSLGRIGRYGLARVDEGLQLHRLTQAVLRGQLTAGQAAVYRGYAQALLAAADPGDEWDPVFWPGWAQILPHLLAARPATSPSAGFRDLACRAAYYLWMRGDTGPARDLAEHLHLAWRESLGPDDPHALRAAGILVKLLTDLGQHHRARQLGEDTLARFRRSLGADHPHTLRAAQWLAVCLHQTGAFEQASELHKDTLARRRRALGQDDLDCQRTALNLGRDLRALGQVQAALRLHADTVAWRRRILGDDHPNTINAVNELGASLRAATQIEAARGLHQDNVARARRVLGDDHTWTLDGQKELASDLHALGDFDAARQLSQDTLARARRTLGDDSHFTIDAANNLAADLHALGEDEAARQLSQDILARSRRAFGDNHPLTLRAASNLADALQALGKARNDG